MPNNWKLSDRFGLDSWYYLFFSLLSRSHSVESSEVRISIRFRIRSQIVLCRFSRDISDNCRWWSWGNRWTFKGWGASYVWVIPHVCSKIWKIRGRRRLVIYVIILVSWHLGRRGFVIRICHFLDLCVSVVFCTFWCFVFINLFSEIHFPRYRVPLVVWHFDVWIGKIFVCSYCDVWHALLWHVRSDADSV